MNSMHSFYSLAFWRWVLWAMLLTLSSGASAQPSTTVYENRQLRFAITPPHGWVAQQTRQTQGEAVVKFLGPGGSLSVAARPAQDFHKKIIGLISQQYELSEKQLADLARDIYGNVPGVFDPTLTITYLSSYRALGSFYAYEHRSLGSVMYMLVFKAETIRGDTFYKVEITGPAAPTLEEASKLFSASSNLLLKHMRTFAFLPGKTQ